MRKAKTLLVTMVVFGLALVSMSPTATADRQEPQINDGLPLVCGASGDATRQETIQGNGASVAALYESPGGAWYASWAMSTNNLDNGADAFVFGVEVDGTQSNGNPHTIDLLQESQSGKCQWIGILNGGMNDWLVEGGAGGFTHGGSCTISFHWEVEVGVSIQGPDGSARLGGSVACTAEIHFDSEILLQARDGDCPPIGC